MNRDYQEPFVWRGITFTYDRGGEYHSAVLRDRLDQYLVELIAKHRDDGRWDAWAAGRALVCRSTAEEALDDLAHRILVSAENHAAALRKIGIEQ